MSIGKGHTTANAPTSKPEAKPSQKNPPLSDLAPEILTLLLNFLDLTSIARLAQAAKPLSQAVKENYPHLKTFAPNTFKQLESFLEHVKQTRVKELQNITNTSNTEQKEPAEQQVIPYNLEVLDLSNLSFNDKKKITNQYIENLCTLFPNLGTLNLSWCNQITDAGLVHLAGLNLTSLYLWGCYKITDARLAYLAGLRKLTSLDLSCCKSIPADGLAHIAKLKNLTSLNLSDCHGITDTGLSHLAGLKSLTSLDLRWCSDITDAGLAHLAGLKSLTSLDLWGCTEITYDSVKDLITKLPQLTYLELQVSENISKEQIQEINQILDARKLKSLNLSDCDEISDDEMESHSDLRNSKSLDLSDCGEIIDDDDDAIKVVTDDILKELSILKKLESINLSNSLQITDAGLKHLSKLKKLETLNLRWCKNITYDGIIDLITKLPNLTSLLTNLQNITSIQQEQIKQILQDHKNALASGKPLESKEEPSSKVTVVATAETKAQELARREAFGTVVSGEDDFRKNPTSFATSAPAGGTWVSSSSSSSSSSSRIGYGNGSSHPPLSPK